MKPYYAHAGITIYHGDCLEVMPLLVGRGIEAVVTDPPFAFAGGISNGRLSMVDGQFFEHWLEDVFKTLERSVLPSSPWFLWSDWRSLACYDRVLRRTNRGGVSQVLIHDRETIGMGFPFRNQVDFLAYVGAPEANAGKRIPREQGNVIRFKWPYGEHEHHPAEKALQVTKRLVQWSADEWGTVLDPFMGSGTTLEAAKATKRQAIGIEIEERYCEIAARRLAQEVLPLGELV